MTTVAFFWKLFGTKHSLSDMMRVEEQDPALPPLCASAAAPAYAPGNLVIGLIACRHAAS